MEIQLLQAGPWEVAFLPDTGALQSVYYGGHEFLRGVSAPVRDHVWVTLPPVIDERAEEIGAGAFAVRFQVRCTSPEVDVVWRGELTASQAEGVRFSFRGEALRDSLVNRVGFCVLHPAGAAGSACQVEHVDGSVESGTLPIALQPWQPFRAIRAFTHEAAPGLQCTVKLEGDEFEMEDQRNWTDASFKIYSPPLSRPAPRWIRRGERVEQRVIIQASGAAMHTSKSPPSAFRIGAETPEHTVSVGEPTGHVLPAIGTQWCADFADERIWPFLKNAGFAHLRIDLRLADSSVVNVLQSGAAAAACARCGLEIALHVTDAMAAELERLGRELQRLSLGVPVARWLIFQEGRSCTPPSCVAALRAAQHRWGFGGSVGAGTTDNFTELNREPDVAADADHPVFGCNPQVHATDPLSIFQTLPVQRLAAEAAQKLAGGRAAVVSTVTFSRRWRPGEFNNPSPLVPAALMPFHRDARLPTAMGAAWFIGSVTALAAAGVASATYFEAAGEGGFVPETGEAGALAQALQEVTLARAAPLRRARSSTDEIAALAFETKAGLRVLLANLRDRPVELKLSAKHAERLLQLAPFAITAVNLA